MVRSPRKRGSVQSHWDTDNALPQRARLCSGPHHVRDASPEASGGIAWGALAHVLAGISAVIIGGLMYTRPWAQDVFALLMIVTAVSAVYFSWKHTAWVTRPWLAMVPVTGVAAGYLVWQWGFALAYLTLCLAFIHLVIRGLQSLRGEEPADPS